MFLAPTTEAPDLYYEFEVNPLGALFDARIESPQRRRSGMRIVTDWSCEGFVARVKRHPGRWSASIRIPLDAVCGSAPSEWRANFFRIDRGVADEFSAWSPTLADPADFHVPEKFGTLRLNL